MRRRTAKWATRMTYCYPVHTRVGPVGMQPPGVCRMEPRLRFPGRGGEQWPREGGAEASAERDCGGSVAPEGTPSAPHGGPSGTAFSIEASVDSGEKNFSEGNHILDLSKHTR